MSELSSIMGNMDLRAAQEELQKAREQVDRLKAEAIAAKSDFDRVNGGVNGGVDGATSSQPPAYGSQKYWETSYSNPSVYTATASYEWYMSHLPRFLPLFRSLLSSTRSPVAMDIGCGNSSLLSYLHSSSLIASGVGMDYSPTVVRALSSVNSNPSLSYATHDLRYTIPSSLIPPSSLDAAFDKGTLDAVLSSGVDEETSLKATNTAKNMYLNALSVIKPDGMLVCVTNLPPDMALPFFATINCDTRNACVARFAANTNESVGYSHGLSTIHINDCNEDKCNDDKCSSDMVYVYKLTRDTDLNVLQSIARNTKSNIRSIEDVNVGTLEKHKKAYRDAENERVKAGIVFDDATKGLVDAVENEQLQHQQQQQHDSSANDANDANDANSLKQEQDRIGKAMSAVGHDRILDKYAAMKGKQQQGYVGIDHNSCTVGRWCNSSDNDIEIWIEKCDTSCVDVEITRNVVTIVMRRNNADNDDVYNNPEYDEFNESDTLILQLSHSININDSTWLIDSDGCVCINLVKIDTTIFWDKLCPNDINTAEVRDYSAIATNLDDEKPAKAVTVHAKVSVPTSKIIVSFTLTPASPDSYRDYAVLTPISLPDTSSAQSYIEFEYLFTDEDAVKSKASLSLPLTESTLSLEGDFEVRILDHITHSVIGRSASFKFVQPPLISQVHSGCSVSVEWQSNIRVMAVYVSGEVPECDSYKATIHGDAVEICTEDGAVVARLHPPDAVLKSLESANVAVRDDYLCARLRYGSAMNLDVESFINKRTSVSSALTSPALLSTLSCRFCSHSLLSKTTNITKTLPLPEGFWDEIGDYLACHAESVVNFNSACIEARRNRAMEDDTVLLLHGDDVGDAASVLAIEGYMEADAANAAESKDGPETAADINFRGQRDWTSGGATVCCNRCCSVLGFASLLAPESIRLYKHRLLCGPDETHFADVTVASFLAREMTKYASTQAVFAFVGVCTGMKKKVVMKLLAWDSVCGVGGGGGGGGGGGEEGEGETGYLRKCAKILWGMEEWNPADDGIHNKKDKDELLFSWADMCCNKGEEGEGKEVSKATVKLFLSDDEWQDLLDFFAGKGSFFPSEVAEATALAQGFVAKAGEMGLAVVPF
jgi:hypothetical protein